jgi:hypothetical protein
VITAYTSATSAIAANVAQVAVINYLDCTPSLDQILAWLAPSNRAATLQAAIRTAGLSNAVVSNLGYVNGKIHFDVARYNAAGVTTAARNAIAAFLTTTAAGTRVSAGFIPANVDLQVRSR